MNTQFLKKLNLALLILPILIFLLGELTLISTTPERARTQGTYFVVGMLGYAILSFVDYELLRHYWKPLYISVLLLLILTFFLGEIRSGSARWIGAGGFTFQPSELAKLSIIVSLAALLSTNKNTIHKFKELLRLTGLVVLLVAFVFVQPDLSTSVIILLIFVGLLFYSGLHIYYFLAATLCIGIFSTPLWSLLHDYQKERILVFVNPQLDILGAGYNVIQSVIAVGSGQLLGRGFGRGTQSHLQFLPAYWTDFIFASYAEEWGFLGVVMLIILFSLLLLTLLYVAFKVKDTFGSLISIGVFVMFFGQYLVNVGMNMGIMPVTGIPLPLVSYGGTSLVVSLLMLGIVQSVWIYKR
ncbi:MAG: rod shape-determining protein RodA [Patescibacteria group bacterium]